MANDPLEQLERLSVLLEKGLVTREEFDLQKARLLGQPPSSQQETPLAHNNASAPPQTVAVPQPRPKPPAPKASGGYQWTGGRILMALFVLPALFFLMLTFVGGGAAITAVSGGKALTGLPILPTPKFKVSDIEVNDSCARLIDYCVRVTCTVTNIGTGSGDTQVEVQLIPKGKNPSVDTTSITLPVGQSRVISHDFTEARLGDDHQGKCIVR